MRTRWPGWSLVALVVTLALGAPVPARAQASGTVLEEILEIMRKSGQISEAQKKALLERAEREAAERAKAQQATAAPRPAPAEPAKTPTVTAGVENLKPYLASPDGAFRLERAGCSSSTTTPSTTTPAG